MNVALERVNVAESLSCASLFVDFEEPEGSRGHADKGVIHRARRRAGCENTHLSKFRRSVASSMSPRTRRSSFPFRVLLSVLCISVSGESGTFNVTVPVAEPDAGGLLFVASLRGAGSSCAFCVPGVDII